MEHRLWGGPIAALGPSIGGPLTPMNGAPVPGTPGVQMPGRLSGAPVGRGMVMRAKGGKVSGDCSYAEAREHMMKHRAMGGEVDGYQGKTGEQEMGAARADTRRMQMPQKRAKGGKVEGGGRFKKLEGKLAHRKGVTDPAGLAAYIGREKYGSSKMAKMSAAGRKRH